MSKGSTEKDDVKVLRRMAVFAAQQWIYADFKRLSWGQRDIQYSMWSSPVCSLALHMVP